MFPACAGMNRNFLEAEILNIHVPRVRGDEPWQPLKKPFAPLCSPRARG